MKITLTPIGKGTTTSSIWLVMLVFFNLPPAVNGQDVVSLSNSASYYDSSMPGYGIARGGL
jgi:hypothetical protein